MKQLGILLMLITTQIMATPTISMPNFVADALNNIPTTLEQISSQFISPIIGNGTMTTPSGSSFNIGALSCPSSDAFLKVLAQPGSTGDLTTLQFSRDKDLNGTIDTVQHFPEVVSGVCANGLISCDVGTWNNCTGYQWQANNDNLNLVQNSLSRLGGCYCINSSCGNANRTNRILSSIVSDLGSGAAAALSKNNPNYIISNAQVIGPLAKFYGQNLSSCKDGNTTNLVNYQSNPADLESQTNNYKNNADGLYQAIAHSSVASNSLINSQTCQINRNTNYQDVTVKDIISYNGGTGGLQNCADDDCVILTLGNTNLNRLSGSSCRVVQDAVSFFIHRIDRISNPILTNANFDDWIRVAVNNQPVYAHPYNDWDGVSTSGKTCQQSREWRETPNSDINIVEGINNFDVSVQSIGGYTEQRCRYKIRNKCFGRYDVTIDNAGGGYALAKFSVDTSCDINQEWITNSCEAIANNPKCRLKSETIDGVKTYQYYNSTGLSPVASERQIGGGSCDLKITRPWWNATREYECQIENDIDFSVGITRNAAIEQSASSSTYTDLIGGINTPRNLTIPNIAPAANCTNACKIKRPKDKVPVAGTGPVATTETEYDIIYQACTGPDNSICQTDENDILVTSCSCLNEFGAASTMMQSLRQAAQDLTCTSGNPAEF